ncbi:rRNA maturation RNase YbeY [Telmatospirillum siberiense]|uniref:Endoribonuclease YbeY n=1 Tax=Telmatospirillum siberiense TaxID=382514 RepID=A0A2N3PSL0_9PROT|nr:rRNA maturation RNase YbeY [Telmatospirillum siberiense]PKU23389.1 rRNA maturation RNase YbeY [Telmatospirillum siberiense]
MPCEHWSEALADVEGLCRRVVLAALDGSGEVLSRGTPEQVEVSLVLADDAMVQELNRQYRGQDKPTNVLSFAALDGDDEIAVPDGPLMLGDVVLAFETTTREALAEGKPLADHLSHLLVHGILHLLGYDHLEEAEAEEMEGRERVILAGLGIADPYALPPGSEAGEERIERT